ncbi:MAG: DUF2306 domain-containing protein [Planctomycetaceae bacterium]
MFAAAVALSVVPLQFIPNLRASRPRLHRWLGRTCLLISVGVGDASGLYMSWFAFGGAVSTAGRMTSRFGLPVFPSVPTLDVQNSI